MEYLILALIGVVAGVFSGMLGIGGGIIMIPALAFFLGYSQHMAQGTTLAVMVFPIGIFAALEYYRNGYVNPMPVVAVALAFVVGAYLGAKIAVRIDASVLKKVFALYLIVIGVKMLMEK